MDINEILGAGGHTKRPDHPDFYRILEITQQMLAEMRENEGDLEKQEQLWRARIAESVDFDSLSYQAIQVGMSLHNIKTALDLRMMQRNEAKMNSYVRSIQAFYDGFLTGVQFQKRGGKQ